MFYARIIVCMLGMLFLSSADFFSILSLLKKSIRNTISHSVNSLESDQFVCLFGFYMSKSTIFQLCWDRSSWLDLVL